MKINNYSSNQPFQKLLKANCHIIKDEIPTPCTLYQMEASDVGYFKKASDENQWKGSCFITKCEKMLKLSISNGRSLYSMEDETGNCIAFCEVDHNPNNSDILEVIEVCPDYAYEKYKRRKTKYIGETFINFLAQNAIRNGKDKIVVDSAVDTAVNFYHDKCNMKKEKKLCRTEYILDASKINKFKEKNKTHTGKEIEFLRHSWFF